MDEKRRADTAAVIGKRLDRLRRALGYETQLAFAMASGMEPTALNNNIQGRSRISLDAAAKLRLRYGVTFDWIYLGIEAGLPRTLADALDSQPGVDDVSTV